MWKTRTSMDWAPTATVAGLAVWLLPIPHVVMLIVAPCAAGVVAVMGSIVTFACTGVYQSTSDGMRALRRIHGPRVRRIWSHSIVSIIACALVMVIALGLAWAPYGDRVGSGLLLGATVLAILRTMRSVSWLEMAWAAADSEAGLGLVPEEYRKKRHSA
ncbi:hypothetical protein C0Z11_08490 [Acidipropionibacterium jensenii]|uniref:hypothetical protein n=1 Tax=Acidipropionibacterium jensenii TaxID=1749 RepID=UPI000BC30EB8|nr:hypothetical protein [Acidipropionibacterium jensenii]AZZ42316.1 hypothetical protein C0Z11_08490 [Acidipropionibacterium jensenii]